MRSAVSIVLFALMTASGIPSASAQGYSRRPRRNPVYLMGVMGDSISAGFIANTTLDDWIAKKSRETGTQPDQDGIFEHKESYSWASGKKINSHFERLRAIIRKQDPGADLRVMNVARSGAVASDIPQQAQDLSAAIQSGKYRSIKYVTLFIGANDVCSSATGGTPDENMRESLLKAFAILAQIEQREPIRVLVVGLPEIPELAIPQIDHSRTIFDVSCHFLRDDLLHACHPLLDWRTPAGLERRLSFVEDKNALIQRTVEEAAEAFPKRLEIHFTPKLWETPISRADLAIDCFHPGRIGQASLSQLLWKEQPWYK